MVFIGVLIVKLGTYKAVKDVAMRTGKSAWMLMDGGEVEVTKVDEVSREARYQHTFPNGGTTISWMHFSRYSKCFVYIGSD